jgi:NAD(P)-dependent dehydrogenase (short-subunit alcohol dehydrogenase family)
MAVNLKSMFLTCKAVLPAMEHQGGGVINQYLFHCCDPLLRGALHHVLYDESGDPRVHPRHCAAVCAKNIRANCILPGLMNTPMIVEPLKGVYGAGDVDKMIAMRNQQCPTGKMGDAWDVAHAAVFLTSDEAKYITGAQIVVDGGISCKMV